MKRQFLLVFIVLWFSFTFSKEIFAQNCNSCTPQYGNLGLPVNAYPPPCGQVNIPLPTSVSANEIRYDINILNYGAVVNDNIDDTQAFDYVSCLIRSICQSHQALYGSGNPQLNVDLYIPGGSYLVGRVHTSNSFPLACSGLVYKEIAGNVLNLRDCFNVNVHGEHGLTLVKYNSGLNFGAINTGVSPCVPNASDRIPCYDCTALIGSFIYIENCQNIVVRGIDADGMVRPANNIVSLHYSLYDNGIQLPFNGVTIIDSNGSTRNITLDSINMHHFGQDGIMIRCATPQGFNSPANNITILNSRFEFNVRQGLSWVGGVGLTVENCDFNSTGKANPLRPASDTQGSASQYAFSNPGAGIDLEPDGNSINYLGLFTNCRILDNIGWGVISAAGGEGSTRGVTFKNCTVFSNAADQGSAIAVRMPEFVFKQCNIYGKVLGGYAATTDWEATRYEDCLFSDLFVAPNNTQIPATTPLIDMDLYAARRLWFQNCSFERNFRDEKIVMLRSNHFSIADRCRFISCQFNLLDQAGAQPNGIGTIEYCIFSGNNIIKNHSSTFTMNGGNFQQQTLSTSGLIIDGTLTLEGAIYLPLHHYTCGADLAVRPVNTQQQATLRLKNQAFMQLHPNAVLAVGAKGSIELDGTNAALYASNAARVFMDDKGNLKADNGSYLCINPGAAFRRPANSVSVTSSGNVCLPPNIYSNPSCTGNCLSLTDMNKANTGVNIQTECSEVLYFDGSNDKAHGVPLTVSDLNIKDHDFTISVFFKRNKSVTPPQPILLAKYHATTAKGYVVGLTLAGQLYRPFIRVNNHTVNANFLLRDDCTLLTIVRKDNCIDFYENGVLRQTINISPTLNWDMTNTAELVLAAESMNQTISLFGGWIGELAIWKTALCPNQVAAHFQGQIPGLSRAETIVFWDFTADLTDQTHADHYGDFAELILGNTTQAEAKDPTWWMEHQISCANGAQLRDMAVAETLEEVYTWQVSVYPNPFNDRIYVTLPAEQTQQAEISLYSTEGKLIFQQRLANTAGAVELDVDVPPGFYMLEVRQGENRQTVKVLKI